jgi:hypothetical protein
MAVTAKLGWRAANHMLYLLVSIRQAASENGVRHWKYLSTRPAKENVFVGNPKTTLTPQF